MNHAAQIVLRPISHFDRLQFGYCRIRGHTGYFGERLKSAQAELVQVWKRRSAELKPTYRSTDIVGALVLAGQLFDEHPRKSQRILVIFSDMRDTALGFDFASLSRALSFSQAAKKANFSVADLHGVLVYALGVDGAGKPVTYWQNLREFWAEYLGAAGADLKSYSVLREPLKSEPLHPRLRPKYE